MSRCAHDLDTGSCADCRPRPGQPQATAAPGAGAPDLLSRIDPARGVLEEGDEAVAAYLLGMPVADIRRVSGGHG